MAKPTILPLRLVVERKVYRLLPMCTPASRLESSGLDVAGDNLLIVFDNLGQIARVPFRLTPPKLGMGGFFGPPGKSGFEDIALAPGGRLFVLRETVKEKNGFASEVIEWNEHFERTGSSLLEFHFKTANKGFEGLAWTDRTGRPTLMALCEGNCCCNGKKGRIPGGGRIQLFERTRAAWVRTGELALPKTVPFEDYSGIAVDGNRVAVVSQATPMLWVNRLKPGRWEWAGSGQLYEFPRSRKGKRRYYTVEGLAWLGPRHLACVSDRRKRTEPLRAMREDQSVHIFRLG